MVKDVLRLGRMKGLQITRVTSLIYFEVYFDLYDD